MNKEAIDLLIERNPALASARHSFERMIPGSYCIHRSWGFGQIKEYDSANNKLIINFQDGKGGHAMDPLFCVGKLEILDSAHILVRQYTEPDTVADMLKKQPVEIIIEILSSHPNGTVAISELETLLKYLLGEIKYKKWWANTKKLLVRDPRIAVPVKKTDPYVLRDEPLTSEQEILEEFYANKNPLKKILLAEKLYQLSNSVEEIANDLPQILEDLTEAVKKARMMTQAERLHGVWVRNDLCRSLHANVDALEPTSTSIIKETDNLSELAEALPSNYYPRFLDLIRRVFPDTWQTVAIGLLKNSTGKFTSECITFLMERECTDLVIEAFKKWLTEQSFKGPVLYWIIKNRNTRRFNKIVKDLICPRLLTCILYAIDQEALLLSTNRRILLSDALGDDQELIPDLLSTANLETARDLALSLLHNQGFDQLSKKSLLARFIKKFPEIQSLISGKDDIKSKEDDSLIVSAESLDIRKQEYETLVNEKIPQNKEAIAVAREHGDLRENAEYKMARQDQDVFLARKAYLEAEFAKAKVTDFSDAKNDIVSIGSIVSVLEGSTQKIHEYAILGAWDSNPDKNILSYKTPLGLSILGKKVGNKVSVEIADHQEEWTIKRISRWVDNPWSSLKA